MNKLRNKKPNDSNLNTQRIITGKLIINIIISIFLIICLTLIIKKVNISNVTTIIADKEINKPLIDKREYEIIRLNNKLEVTLINDVNENSFVFSVSTLLGMNNHLIRYPGLSKLLHHNLIYRNNKLVNLINQYYGSHSLIINDDTSSFTFEIDNEKVEDAFQEITNLLSQDQIIYDNNKEKIIEDLNNILDEQTNQQILIDYLVSKKQNAQYDPLYKNGSNKLFNNYEEVINNYKLLFNTYYSPQSIKISILSNHSIFQLKNYVVKYFSQLRNRFKNDIPHYFHLKEKEIQYQELIWIKPKSEYSPDSFRILLHSNEFQPLKNSSLLFFQYLFNDNKPNSFWDSLITSKYISSYSLEIKNNMRYGNYIQIDMILDKYGYERLDYIIKVILGLLKTYQNKSNLIDLINNLKQIYHNNFLFHEVLSNKEYLREISYNMLFSQEYSNLLFCNYDIDNLSYDKIKEYFTFLNIEHTTFIVKTNKTFLDGHYLFILFPNLDKLKYSSQQYLINDFNVKYYSDNCKTLIYQISLSYSSAILKESNPYISLKNEICQSCIEEDVVTIINDSKLKLWYKKDTSLNIQKTCVFLHFIIPHIRTDDEITNGNKSNYLIFISKMMIELEENVNISGNKMQTLINENGIFIEIEAFKDVIKVIFDKIYKIFFKYQRYYQYWPNFSLNIKDEFKSLNYLSKIVKSKVDISYITKSTTAENLDKDYYSYNANNLYLECLLFGDIDESFIKDVTQKLIDVNCSNKSKEIEKNFPNQRNIDEILDFLLINYKLKDNHINLYKLTQNFDRSEKNYFISFYQLFKRNLELDILSHILCLIFNSFIDESNYKLNVVYKDKSIYLRVIETSYILAPIEMAKTFETKILKFLEYVNNMTYEKYERAYLIIKKKLIEKKKTVIEKGKIYWETIINRENNFIKIKNYKTEIEKLNLQNNFLYFTKFFCKNTLWDYVSNVVFWITSINFNKRIDNIKIQYAGTLTSRFELKDINLN